VNPQGCQASSFEAPSSEDLEFAQVRAAVKKALPEARQALASE
jgi:hypothetical protein